MNTTGITFDGTAPMMEGTWFNPKTGDVITIRDTFFENNNYIARTTDGRFLSYSQLQNYVRDDSKSASQKNNTDTESAPVAVATDPKVAKPAVPPVNPDSMLSQEDLNILEGLSEQDNPQNKSAVQEVQNGIARRMNGMSNYLNMRGQELDISDQILNRAMEDECEPVLNVQVVWNAPVQKLVFLKENMGITDRDIVRWITRSLENRDLSSDINNSINEWVSGIFGNEQNKTESSEDAEKPKGPLKVPKKKVPVKKK